MEWFILLVGVLVYLLVRPTMYPDNTEKIIQHRRARRLPRPTTITTPSGKVISIEKRLSTSDNKLVIDDAFEKKESSAFNKDYYKQ